MIRRSKGALKEAFVLFVLVLPRWWWLCCVMPERRILKHMCSNGLRVFRERISRPRPPSWDPLTAHSSASSSRSRGRRYQCPLSGGGGYCMGEGEGGEGGRLASPIWSYAHPHKPSRDPLRLSGRPQTFLQELWGALGGIGGNSRNRARSRVTSH